MPISQMLRNAISNQKTRKVDRTSPRSDSDEPDFIGHAHRDEAPAVKIVRDVWAGTLRLRDEGETYLPRFPREDREAWRQRRDAAVLFNAYRRSVKGLTGMVFRKDPVLGGDVPDAIARHLENVDLGGRDLTTFARDVFEDALVDGHAYVWVDFSRTEDQPVRSRADELRIGARPYWCAVPKSAVLSFRVANRNGRPVPTQVAWHERTVEGAGDFGEEEVTRIRVHRLEGGRVVMRLFEKVGPSDWRTIEELALTIDELPIVAVYTNRAGFFRSEPPLLDLALENVRHYQLRSDRDNTLHVAGVPVPIFTGASGDDVGGTVTVGPTSGIFLPADGDAKYLEPRGVALESSRQELQDVERRMATLGLSMLQSETRAAETAQSKRIDKAESDSQLSTAARGLQHALDEALRLHAKWMRLADGGSVAVNRDFEARPIDARLVDVLSRLVANNQLSLDSMWSALVAGEILGDGFDPDTERDRLEQQGIGDLETFLRARSSAA